MKKIIIFLLTTILLIGTTACGKTEATPVVIEPKASQMKAICELSVMDCYYHNVAKFKQEDAQGHLWWSKDKHFWIEYSGVVTLGIDASLVTVDVKDTKISITLPEAKVLGCKVDSASLSEDSFIVEKNSAKVDGYDEVKAFEAAQDKLKETASADKALLASAQQRAQALLEDYITNVGNAVGNEYTIQWIYLDAEGNQLSMETVEPNSRPEEDSSEVA